jgi:uncharacterized protein YaeQ
MALTSTIYNFAIDLSDGDRQVYEHLELRVARHPSESEDYLLARVLAYCLEFTAGIEFSKGLSDPEDPPLSVRDLTGRILTWIEIGTPDAARLHKAGKSADRVVMYAHRDPTQAIRAWAGERIHRVEALEVYRFDRPMLDALMAGLDRRTTFALAVHDRELFIAIDDASIEGRVSRVQIP